MNNLLSELEKHGYRGQITSVQHLGELEAEIEGRHRLGEFSEEFYRERLTEFQFKTPEALPDAKSLVVVAFPQPKLRVIFNWQGKSHPLLIPPTYLHYPDKVIEELLTGILAPKGYHLAKAQLPQKLLAARCGLGSYGKNNICYVPSMGSFHRLMAFYSDFPCTLDSWQEAQMLEKCQNCSACLRSCPTAAITAERFLLRAEHCITFHNERVGDFPPWLDPSWHNSLVGCLHCQSVCPLNKNFLGWIEEKEEFSEEETALLLQGTPQDKLPTQILKKLENLDLMEYFEVLPRNLQALL